MYKKTNLLWVVLAIALIALLAAGCQPQATQPPAEPTKAPAVEPTKAPAVEPTKAPSLPEGMIDTTQYKKEAPYTVCFSNASVSNSWRVAMNAHVEYQVNLFKEQGLIDEYIYTDANDDPNKQISDIEDLMTKGCDVMIVSAATGEALTPVVEKAMDAGIPVVTLDRNIVSDKYVTFVEQNSCDMGATQAKWLAEKLGGKGKIVLLSGLAGATPAEDRLRCAKEEFAKYPDIEVLAQEYAQWSPVEGKKIMANWLVTYPQIDGVWADSGLQASGAVEAFQEAGKPVPPITGEDWNRYLKLWKQLGFPGYAVSFNAQMGAEAVKVALDIVQGKPVPHYVNLPKLIIDQDNLDQYVRMDLPDDYWAASLPEVAAIMFPEGSFEQPTEEAPAVAMIDTTQYKKEAPYTVCFSNASVSNSWRVAMNAHVEYQVNLFKEQGLIDEYIYTDANDDPNKQISDIEDLMTKGCDVMIVSAATGEALTPVVEKAMDAGIPVVTLDRNIVSDKYVTFVEQNSCDMGATQAKWLAEKLGGKGKIVLLSGLAGATPAEDRLRCAKEEFAKYPDIEVLAQEYAQWSPVEGKKIMANWLVTYPQIDGVWADSGLQASGAVEAFQEAGKPVPPITGEDWNRYLKLWKQLGFPGYAVSFNAQMGAEAVKVALDIVQGKPVPHYVNLPKLIIDQDNLDQYVRMDLPDDYWAASLPEVAAIMFP